MKNLLIIFFIGIFLSSAQIETINVKNKISQIIENEIKDTLVKINTTDIETLDKIINSKKEKYKIIYSFSNTCHFSFDAFPDLINYVKEQNGKYALLIVVSSRYEEIESITKYFSKIKYYEPIYILDTVKYGNKKNPSPRNELMISKLCKECNNKKMGFSDLFIRGNNDEIIYHSNYDIPWEKIFENIKKFINVR